MGELSQSTTHSQLQTQQEEIDSTLHKFDLVVDTTLSLPLEQETLSAIPTLLPQ